MFNEGKKKYLVFASLPLFFMANPVTFPCLFYNFLVWYLYPPQFFLDMLSLWQNPLAWSMLWFTLFFPGGEIGLYFAVLLVSIIGNLTIILPVPYVIFLWFLMLFRPWTNALIIGLCAGLGAAIGETSAWLIGRGGQELIKDSSYGQRLVRYGNIIERGWGFPFIVLFAATPLPDDMLMLALGLVDYSYIKAIIATIIGKVIMCSLIAYGAQALSNVEFFGKTILEWFSGETGLTTMIASIAVLVIIFLALIYVDWEKLCGRIRRIGKQKKVEQEKNGNNTNYFYSKS
ncbi:MAG: VTT domain-containing protein [Candidatus Freyarchaeota archaeon]